MPMKKRKPTTRLPSGVVTFLFTDIVNYSSMKGKMAKRFTIERQDAFVKNIKQPHDEIINRSLTKNGGTKVKDTGDGFLIVFRDVEKAVFCGVEIQENLRRRDIRLPKGAGSLRIRIGIHTGMAEPKGGDYPSEATDKAKRIQENGKAGDVFLSTETHVLVRDKIRGVSTRSVGFHKLKGFDDDELFVASRIARKTETKKVRAKSKLITVRVLIGDPDEQRFLWLQKLLRDEFKVDAIQASTFEEVKRIVEEGLFDSADRLIFLCDILPFSSTKSTPNAFLNFVRLEMIASYPEFVCIVTKDHDPNLDGLSRWPHVVHLTRLPPTEQDRQTMLTDLGRLGDRFVRRSGF